MLSSCLPFAVPAVHPTVTEMQSSIPWRIGGVVSTVKSVFTAETFDAMTFRHSIPVLRHH